MAPMRRAREARLDITVPHQRMNQWCWAAVATGVATHYDATSTWTQCQVASVVWDQTCCPAQTNCDEPAELTSALEVVGHAGEVTPDRVPFASLCREIDDGKPVGVRIQWLAKQAGHFVLLEGYLASPDGNFLFVEDPIYGSAEVNYPLFPATYHEEGAWTHSYWTNRA